MWDSGVVMNWEAIGVISGVLIFLTGAMGILIRSLATGLAQSYFNILIVRIENVEKSYTEISNHLKEHLLRDEQYQQKMLLEVQGLREGLIKFKINESKFLLVSVHNEAVHRIENEITEGRHKLRNEFQAALTGTHGDICTKLGKLEDKIDRLAERE